MPSANRPGVRVPFGAPNTVGIAQLVRAPDCGSGGRRFESDYPPPYKKKGILPFFHICLNMEFLFVEQYNRILGCRQVVRQRTLTPSFRWSESSQPSQRKRPGASFRSGPFTFKRSITRREKKRLKYPLRLFSGCFRLKGPPCLNWQGGPFYWAGIRRSLALLVILPPMESRPISSGCKGH